MLQCVPQGIFPGCCRDFLGPGGRGDFPGWAGGLVYAETAHEVPGCANYGGEYGLCNLSNGLRSPNTKFVSQEPQSSHQAFGVNLLVFKHWSAARSGGLVARRQTWAARRAQKFPDPAPHLPSPKGAAASFPWQLCHPSKTQAFVRMFSPFLWWERLCFCLVVGKELGFCGLPMHGPVILGNRQQHDCAGDWSCSACVQRFPDWVGPIHSRARTMPAFCRSAHDSCLTPQPVGSLRNDAFANNHLIIFLPQHRMIFSGFSVSFQSPNPSCTFTLLHTCHFSVSPPRFTQDKEEPLLLLPESRYVSLRYYKHKIAKKKVFNFQTKGPRCLFNDNLNAWAGIPCSRLDQIAAQVHGAQSGPRLLNYIVLTNVT